MDHDAAWKRLFGLPILVEHLLRGFAGPVAGLLDFGTLRQLSASWVGVDRRQRHGDAVWRVDYGDGTGRSLVLLLEFQSRVDLDMAPRILRYAAMVQEHLRRQGETDADGRVRLLPVVIHSSRNRWTAPGGADGVELSADGEVPMLLNPYLLLDARRLTREHLPRHNLVAALFGLDAARTESELAGHMRELSSWLPAALASEAADAVLTAVFDWLSTAASRIVPDSDTADLVTALRRELRKPEERMTLLAERMEEWKADWLRQGMQQGLEQGLEQGIERGLAAERNLLRRLAERKFDRASADKLARCLTAEKDPEYFAQVGSWIIDCGTGEELLDRMRLK